MTKDETLRELDALKDLTNETGKKMVEGIRSWVAAQPERVAVGGAIFEEVLPKDRRSEERDPGETEQKQAKKLKLPVLN